MQKKLSLLSLSLLIIAAIDSIRNLPAAALFGTSMIFFFILGAVMFLIPTSLVAAELSAAFPEEGGVYHWVNKAFGQKFAMAAIWLQWINTMVWYPTMLSFVAGTFAYLINPELAQNKGYIISCVLIVFWGLTLLNQRGIHTSVKYNSLFASIGLVLPMCLLIILGAIWFFSGQPLQIDFATGELIPSFTRSASWVSLVAIMASFLGIELAGVHVNDIRNPQKNFPKAVLISAFFIFSTMLLGSLAIAIVLPESEISLVAGVMQLFSSIFGHFGLRPLIPVMTVLITLGSIGTMINWLISPAKGLLNAAEFGFLPPFFAKKNQHGVANRILYGQAIVVSLVSLIFFLVPSVNAFYWFLTALSTELYMLMYILMFAAALKLRYVVTDRPASFTIPGKDLGLWVVSLLGLGGCFMTIVVSFFAPETIDFASPVKYFLMIFLGNLISLSPLLFFYWFKKSRDAAI